MTVAIVFGATGYIGGSVLVGLKEAFPEFEWWAPVRSDKDIPALEAIGVKAILEPRLEGPRVTSLVTQADFVVNTANADDLNLAKAILAGIKQRSTANQSKPILIHTSGTGLVVEPNPKGELVPNLAVINDANPEQLKSIPPTAPHRDVDLEIFAADQEGYVSAFIIAPSTIYGYGTGPVKRISQQVPVLIRYALKNKKAYYAGAGTNEWNNVHIKDLVQLYVLVAKLAYSSPAPADLDPYTRFFWGSVGLHKWGDIAQGIAKVLFEKGLVDSPTAESTELVPELLYTANNSKTQADRAFSLGWVPKEPSIFDTLKADIESVLAAS